MALKKKSKVSAEFSMSSLTDIIFLLLIFFMLTSSVVVPNALNLKMPSSSSKVVSVDSKPNTVRIEGRGTFKVDGRTVSKSKLESKLRSLARKNGGKKLDMTLTPTRNTTNESMVFVMDIMQRLGINCILAIEE